MYRAEIQGESGPEDIDVILERYFGRPVDVVAAVGEGSLLDAGKGMPARLVAGQEFTNVSLSPSDSLS